MHLLKIITNIFIIICAVCFIALSGYYIYQVVISLREGAQIMNVIINALGAVMLNIQSITMLLACLFSKRQLFLNVCPTMSN